MGALPTDLTCLTCLTCLTLLPQVDNSSVIEIDFIRSDIFEEVLNYMYTAKISVKKKDVNLMMSSGQILGIRFLDKLCSQVWTAPVLRGPSAARFGRHFYALVLPQKRDVSSEDKDKFPYDIVKMALPPEAQLAADAEVLGEHDDTAPPTDDLVEASTNQVLDKSPSAALHVQEAILKELTNEDVHKVGAETASSSPRGVLMVTLTCPGNLLRPRRGDRDGGGA